MNINQFQDIIRITIHRLEVRAAETPTYYTSCDSDSFELRVKEKVEEAINELGLQAVVRHTPGSHVFPDIVILDADGTKFGIEVKSSKTNSWKINGNSVVESTREENLIETYVVFGKLANNHPEFRAKKYEECIADVVVTHSPRYKVDMELGPGHTFFDRSHISYQTLQASPNPISLITDYFRREGHTAWWLTESTPVVIRLLGDIPKVERVQYLAEACIRFPELFSDNPHKYSRCAGWMITTQSIIAANLRDYFSASGRCDITVNGNAYTSLPQIFKRLNNIIDAIVVKMGQIPNETLAESWEVDNTFGETTNEKIRFWINLVSEQIPQEDLGEINTLQLLRDIFAEHI